MIYFWRLSTLFCKLYRLIYGSELLCGSQVIKWKDKLINVLWCKAKKSWDNLCRGLFNIHRTKEKAEIIKTDYQLNFDDSRHEQVSLMSLSNLLAHDVINLSYYELRELSRMTGYYKVLFQLKN